MSLFELAIPTVERHEGGFVNNPADPGGATNFGVSLRWLKSQGLLEALEHDEGDVTHDEVLAVKTMTKIEAEAFYRKYWWDANSYGAIAPQAVATKVFDSAVNLGSPRANRFAQSVAGCPIVDGVIGPHTLAAINAMNSVVFIADYQARMAEFYQSLVAANPARQQFLQGWLNRAYDRI